jgi:hypothetical protein
MLLRRRTSPDFSLDQFKYFMTALEILTDFGIELPDFEEVENTSELTAWLAILITNFANEIRQRDNTINKLIEHDSEMHDLLRQSASSIEELAAINLNTIAQNDSLRLQSVAANVAIETLRKRVEALRLIRLHGVEASADNYFVQQVWHMTDHYPGFVEHGASAGVSSLLFFTKKLREAYSGFNVSEARNLVAWALGNLDQRPSLKGTEAPASTEPVASGSETDTPASAEQPASERVHLLEDEEFGPGGSLRR